MEFDNERVPVSLDALQPCVQIQAHEDEDIYQLTQSIRRAMVIQMTKDHIPVDEERGNLLLKTLDSMDKQVLTRSRLKLDTEVAKTDEEAKAVIASILTNRESVTKLEARPTDYVDAAYEVVLPDTIPAADIVPGMLDVNPAQIEYDQIMEAQTTD